MDVCRVLVWVLVDCGPLVDICRSNTRTGYFLRVLFDVIYSVCDQLIEGSFD